jgi:hypothetical protein
VQAFGFGKAFKEGTMLEFTRVTQPVDKPSRLQLAIRSGSGS